MDVAVDAARQHQQARGVDGAGGRPNVLADRHDPAVANADVAATGVGRGHDGAAADGEIEGHGYPLLVIRVIALPSVPGQGGMAKPALLAGARDGTRRAMH